MRDVVRSAWVGFTSPLEGIVRWMYLDVKGLVTVAIGNLIDPIQYALPLPFVRPDGTPAQRDEIAAEWLRVKNHPTAAKQGHRALQGVTTLRLTDEGVLDVVSAKLAQMDAHLAKRFPEWETWPADAQLATLSMAWACGPAFRFPRLEAALRAQDWVTASNECKMQEAGNPGVVPRNRLNRQLYRNAAIVVASGFTEPPHDPEVLYWPRDLEDEHEEPTQPNRVPSMRPDPLEAKGFATVTRLPGSIADDPDDEPPSAA